MAYRVIIIASMRRFVETCEAVSATTKKRFGEPARSATHSLDARRVGHALECLLVAFLTVSGLAAATS
jgi:hypothetical protein